MKISQNKHEKDNFLWILILKARSVSISISIDYHSFCIKHLIFITNKEIKR